jgi:hypothetical protein
VTTLEKIGVIEAGLLRWQQAIVGTSGLPGKFLRIFAPGVDNLEGIFGQRIRVKLVGGDGAGYTYDTLLNGTWTSGVSTGEFEFTVFDPWDFTGVRKASGNGFLRITFLDRPVDPRLNPGDIPIGVGPGQETVWEREFDVTLAGDPVSPTVPVVPAAVPFGSALDPLNTAYGAPLFGLAERGSAFGDAESGQTIMDDNTKTDCDCAKKKWGLWILLAGVAFWFWKKRK